MGVIEPFAAIMLALASTTHLGIHLWRFIRSETERKKCVFCLEVISAYEHTHHLEICGLTKLFYQAVKPANPPPRQPNGQPFEILDSLFRAVIAVPKAEINRREAEWRQGRKKRTKNEWGHEKDAREMSGTAFVRLATKQQSQQYEKGQHDERGVEKSAEGFKDKVNKERKQNQKRLNQQRKAEAKAEKEKRRKRPNRGATK